MDGKLEGVIVPQHIRFISQFVKLIIEYSKYDYERLWKLIGGDWKQHEAGCFGDARLDKSFFRMTNPRNVLHLSMLCPFRPVRRLSQRVPILTLRLHAVDFLPCLFQSFATPNVNCAGYFTFLTVCQNVFPMCLASEACSFDVEQGNFLENVLQQQWRSW